MDSKNEDVKVLPNNLCFTNTNGKAFWVDIMLVGAMGSGKTTLLNAIESDFVGQTGLGKITSTIHQYSEASDIKSNENALKSSQEINVSQTDAIEKKQEEKSNSYLGRFWSDPGSKFYNKGVHQVRESHLVGRTSELDNVFRILDIPGFGDKQSEIAITDAIENACEKMDYIFYVIDCGKGIEDKASEEYLKKFLRILKDKKVLDDVNIIFLFNKYDLILTKPDMSEFVEKQQEALKQLLESKFKMNIGSCNVNDLEGVEKKPNFQFFNISANDLLMENVIQRKDGLELLKRTVELQQTTESDISEFAANYFGRYEVARLNKKSLDEKIEMICLKMFEIKKQHKQDNQDNQDMSLNKEFIRFLKDLRHLPAIQDKVYDSLFYVQKHTICDWLQLVDLFVALSCFLDHYQAKNISAVERSQIMHKYQQLPSLEKTIVLLLNTYQHKESATFSLTKLSQVWDLFNKKEFDLVGLLHGYLENHCINPKWLNQFENESQNEEFYRQVGQICINYWMKSYASEKQDVRFSSKLEGLMDCIDRFYAKNTEKRMNCFIKLTVDYPGITSDNYATAVFGM